MMLIRVQQLLRFRFGFNSLSPLFVSKSGSGSLNLVWTTELLVHIPVQKYTNRILMHPSSSKACSALSDLPHVQATLES